MLRSLKVLLFLFVTFAFLVFAASNHESVTLSLFPFGYSATMPLFLFALACFALGVIFAGLAASGALLRAHLRFSHEHKRALALENELRGLKAEQNHSLLPPVNN